MKLIQKAIDNHSSCFETGASRLREAIDDEVFVPGVSGMQPTRRAAELAKRGSIVLLNCPTKPSRLKSKWSGTNESRATLASAGSEKYCPLRRQSLLPTPIRRPNPPFGRDELLLVRGIWLGFGSVAYSRGRAGARPYRRPSFWLRLLALSGSQKLLVKPVASQA